MPDFFQDNDYYTGPPADDELINRAEQALGVTLPARYKDLLRERNGGKPYRTCLPTDFPTSWAPDHFEIRGLLGVGGSRGIDSPIDPAGDETPFSTYMIAEWDYPNIGVVFCATPSGGHDTVMLDYTKCGPEGEPSIAYIDEDRQPRTAAGSFEEFIDSLVESSHFD